MDPRRRLLADADEALYLHEYTQSGRTIRGIVGLLPLSARAHEAGSAALVPHEAVHPRQVDELADRMHHVGLEPSPILIAVSDVAGLPGLLTDIAAQPPTRQYVDHVGQHHRIWAIRDPLTTRTANELLAGARGVIADGHHRYAASHRLQVREPGGPYDLAFVMIIDQDDSPLAIEPIHRVLPRVRLADMRAAARAIGATFEFRPSATRPREDEIVVTDGEQWGAIKQEPRPGHAMVEWTHERLLPALPRGPWDILFAHTVPQALKDRSRRGGVAVLLPAPMFSDINSSAFQGRTLPEKATSFQPKPSIGPLMRSVR